MAEEKDCLEELQRIGLRISYFRRVKGMTQADKFIDCRNRSVYCNLLASGTSKASIVSAIGSFANFFSRADR